MAAEYAPSVHEVWSGVYRCGPMETELGSSPGYTSSIRLIVEGNAATISKHSGEISEILSGEISPDGTLRLEGTGTRRSTGTQWHYRYDGRFEGSRFQARGMMFSANLATKLRDCSMTLARMRRSDSSAVSGENAAQAAATEREAAGTLPQAQPQSAPEPQAARQPQSTPEPRVTAEPQSTPEPQSTGDTSDAAPAQEEAPKHAPAPAPAKVVDRELDFSERNDSAMMEGTVERGRPHRYNLIARKGQRLTAMLQSDKDVRFDVYEPGSSITLLSDGFVVQGARLAANEEGTHVDTKLPVDGRYLLLVRSPKEPAFYTLDLVVEGRSPTLLQHWWITNKAWFIAGGAAVFLLLILILRRRKRDRRMFRPD